MAKYERILDCLPTVYAASERRGVLHDIVRELAAPVEDVDTHLFRIQRAHRVRVADDGADLVLLAAALGLERFHFADVLDLDDDALGYEERLTILRERIERVARLSLRGRGTPWAVLESMAIFLDADIVPARLRAPLISHLDAEGFSHVAVIEPKRPAAAARQRLYLHESPLRRRAVEVDERYPLDSWVVQNRNVGSAPVRLVIEGIDDRTVLPTIFCPATGEAIQFNGIVPANGSLIIDTQDGGTLADRPIDRWLIYSKGGTYDFSDWDVATAAIEDRDEAVSLDTADVADLDFWPYQRRKPVPAAPIGRSEWYFTVAIGVYERSALDFSVFDVPREPRGEYDSETVFDGCVFDFPASGRAGMAWSERVPCAFKLLIPPGGADVGRMSTILSRFKPAGIRAFVDVARDAWILGESVIRNAAATDGIGVTVGATRLQSADADAFVPLDPTS